MGFDGVLGMEFPESPHLQHCHSWAGNNSDTALGCVQNTVAHVYDAQPASTTTPGIFQCTELSRDQALN